MEFLQTFIDYFLHLDEKLEVIIENYGTWTYAILFAIIFIETGLIIMPFLPGDSLLFAVGATIAKIGILQRQSRAGTARCDASAD